MPVRIYDIAKKLGIESKEVIAKAKELGIATAKVPSSSLDKITAEYLEQQLGGVAAPSQETPPPTQREPVVIVAPPPEPPQEEAPPAPAPAPAPAPEPIEAEAPAQVPEAQAPEAPPVEEPAPAVEQAATVQPQEQPLVEEPAPQPEPEPEAAEPEPEAEPAAEEAPPKVEPAKPPTPRLGEKVGFIKLPPRPQPRSTERTTTGRAQQQRPQPASPAARTEQPSKVRRDLRAAPGQDYRGVQRRQDSAPAGRQEAAKSAVAPKFVPPSGGELISLKPPVIVRDLASRLNKKPFQLIAALMELNVFANVNQAIDEETAQKLCAKFGYRFEVEKRERGAGIVHAPVKKVEVDIDDKPEDLVHRAPVVTIMGHVDHGKTTLLDVIRKTDVAAGEAGGITQHIGAYTITIPHPEHPEKLEQITFLDTPGHAAFSSMRARGANVTDIVVLVVAANDGVMPQTLEALSHAQAARVPIIVAVNKCDHPNANPARVRQQLQERGLAPEEWGGETIFVDLSALTKQGVDKLLEMLLLQAEVLELKANPKRRAKGNVIESGLEPGGPTATVLVRKGTLRVGETLICGAFYGRVRALINEEGKRLKEAGPSTAVKILGLNGVPEAGLEFTVVENEKNARELAEERAEHDKRQDFEKRPKITLENLFDTLASEQVKAFRVVVKADTQGSVEAIVDALRKIDSSKVTLEVIHSAVGTVTESDVLLASASKAVILGFHTRIDNGVSDIAKREGVQIKLYAIIYELVDQVKEAMAGLLDPLTREVTIGSAEVRKVFSLSKGGNVAGCVVSNGRIVRGKMRVYRRKNLIFEGIAQSLRRFQDEVNEVRSGLECGIRLDGFDDFQEGDTIECYTLEKVAQKL